MLVHQLLHGYKRGHQLLSGSIKLDSQSDELVTRLSDLSGSMTFDQEIRPYLTCYPLPNLKYYAVGKTWLDTTAPRAGCVLTHTLLIPIKSWISSSNLSIFRNLIDKPDSSKDVERYRRALEIDVKTFDSRIPNFQVDSDFATEFIYRFFGEGISPIVWFTEINTEEYFWKFAESFWPQLRGQFACCTFCLQPRFLDDRPFNLMLAPLSVYSRFQQIQRESIIDRNDLLFSSRPQITKSEPWLRKWAGQITKPSALSNQLEDDIHDEMMQLGSFLNSDPTAIKKLYIIQELRKQSRNSSMAPIGLLDMVESLAPGEDDVITYKEECLTIALVSIRYANDLNEILRCLLLLSDRLIRKAYNKIDAKIVEKYYSIVEDYIFKQPDATLQAADRLLNTSTELGDLPYIHGIVLGLMKIGNDQPARLKILQQYANWAPLLIRIEPNLGLLFLNSEKNEYENTNLEILASWISKTSDSVSLAHIRKVMLPEVRDDRYKSLAVELLRLLPESDVYWVLDTLAKSTNEFSSSGIRKVIYEQVSEVYPTSSQKWAVQTDFWSDGAAGVVAATYLENMTGLEELIQTAQYDQIKKAQILAAFIAAISQSHFLPKWFCEFAQNDIELLPTLLPFTNNIPDAVAIIFKKILDEVSDLPIARTFEIEEIHNLVSSYEYFSYSLVESSMRSAIIGYFTGDLDWVTYQKWESTNWGQNWISKVDSKDLQLIIGRKCSESRTVWINGWKWLANASQNLYLRNISLIPVLIESLLAIRHQDWPIEITDLWVLILKRVYAQPKELTAIQCSAEALTFAFHNTRYPVSKVVVQAFLPVYKAVVESETIPHETYNDLFGYFDWDKGKELRKKIIDSFIYSAWPPGDLALSARETTLLRKIYSRLKRHWKGKEYISLILSDLNGRKDNDPNTATTLAEFKSLTQQNSYETWD